MHDPQQRGLQVGEPAERIYQLRLPEQRHRHRVDREVASRQVLHQRRRLNIGQGTRCGIALGSRGGEIDAPVAAANDRCAKPIVLDNLTSELCGDVGDVALNRHVEVGAIISNEGEVPHCTADEVDASVARGAAQRIQVEPRHPRKQLGDLSFRPLAAWLVS